MHPKRFCMVLMAAFMCLGVSCAQRPSNSSSFSSSEASSLASENDDMQDVSSSLAASSVPLDDENKKVNETSTAADLQVPIESFTPIETGLSEQTFTFENPISLNCIVWEAPQATEDTLHVTILSDNNTLYTASGSTVCRFDTIRTQEITVQIQTQIPVSDIHFYHLTSSNSVSAYLPASTTPETLALYLENIQRLDALEVITGLCWTDEGTVLVIDDNFYTLIDALNALPSTQRPLVYATIYPDRNLIQTGKAGHTIDTPQKRTALSNEILQFVQQNQLDGIGIDWETPNSAKEWAYFSAFLCELKTVLEKDDYKLNVALYPENVGRLSDSARQCVDFLRLMSYDQFDDAGRHATFATAYENIQDAAAAGWQREKIQLGLPTYGRPLDAGASWPLYCDLEKIPGENQTGDIYFNSAALIRDKSALALIERLHGVFLYHLTGDLPVGEPLCLLCAICEPSANEERQE